jgi:phosphoglycolate phosphatase-like HAD superfamily hydrolase
MPACAIIWDYDGTLVDSRHRNLSVNRALVEHLTALPWSEFPALASPGHYDRAVARCTGWRDFYEREFGLARSAVEEAGRLWTEYQMSDETPVPLFEGVAEVLEELGDLPHGIVSQNASDIIAATLEPQGVAGCFGRVIGYREVPPERQKPAPDGLLACLETLTDLAPGRAWYVGDHPSDARCAAAARLALRERGLAIDVKSIAVLYGGESVNGWQVAPDAEARTPADIVRIVRAEPECATRA